MTPVLIGVGIGALSGVIAALCGVGGGIIMVPAFTMMLGLNQKNAAATSLAAIVLMAVAATSKNQMNGLVDWRVTIPAALGGALTAWFAADLLKNLSNQTLTKAFAILLIGAGVRMLFEKP